MQSEVRHQVLCVIGSFDKTTTLEGICLKRCSHICRWTKCIEKTLCFNSQCLLYSGKPLQVWFTCACDRNLFTCNDKSLWNWADLGRAQQVALMYVMQQSVCVWESVFHSSCTEADCHTVRQHRDPSSEPLSFVVARPTYIRRWKFRLKCIRLRKAHHFLLSQITKLIWLPWTEVFASIMWLCNCALWPSRRAFINTFIQEETHLFPIAHTLRWWCQNLQSTTALLLSTGCIWCN